MNKYDVTGYTTSSTNGKFEYSQNALEAQMNFLIGKLLTIVDASIADKQQREALKTLVKREVWDQTEYMLSTVGINTKPTAFFAESKTE